MATLNWIGGPLPAGCHQIYPQGGLYYKTSYGMKRGVRAQMAFLVDVGEIKPDAVVDIYHVQVDGGLWIVGWKESEGGPRYGEDI